MDRKIILFADDDANIRNMTLEVFGLEFPDYAVEILEDGESLDGVRVVITDNGMPGMCGSEIIERYARDPRFEGRIPFILCYGGDQEIGERAKKNGAFAYILKPHSMLDFSRTIKKALGE